MESDSYNLLTMAISCIALVGSLYSLYQVRKSNKIAEQNLNLLRVEHTPIFIIEVKGIKSFNNGMYTAQLVLQNTKRNKAILESLAFGHSNVTVTSGDWRYREIPYNYKISLDITFAYPDDEIGKLILESPSTVNEANQYFNTKAYSFLGRTTIHIFFKDETGKLFGAALQFDGVRYFLGETFEDEFQH